MLHYLSRVLELVVPGSSIEQLQIPGNVDDRNSLIAAHQEKQFENLGALVVERRLPPVFNNREYQKRGRQIYGPDYVPRIPAKPTAVAEPTARKA
jgi:hypothetical protein